MNTTKPWYQSVTVWGALVGLLSSFLSLLKIDLDAALLEEIRDWLLSLATLIGTGIALWGRLRASKKIAPPDPNTTKLLLLLPTLFLVGCTSPGDAYIAADRATFDVVAPQYRSYIVNDPSLTEDERARRERTVQTWEFRLDSNTDQRAGTTRPRDSSLRSE